MITYRLALAAVLLVGLAAPRALPAQAEPPAGNEFVGIWALSIDDSDFGMTAAPDSQTMSIDRADDRLVMQRVSYFSHLDGPSMISLDMPTDGGAYEATVRDEGSEERGQEFELSWDGDVLVMVTTAESNVGPVAVVDRISLDDGGRRIFMGRTVDVPGAGTVESTLVFVRQE